MKVLARWTQEFTTSPTHAKCNWGYIISDYSFHLWTDYHCYHPVLSSTVKHCARRLEWQWQGRCGNDSRATFQKHPYFTELGKIITFSVMSCGQQIFKFVLDLWLDLDVKDLLCVVVACAGLCYFLCVKLPLTLVATLVRGCQMKLYKIHDRLVLTWLYSCPVTGQATALRGLIELAHERGPAQQGRGQMKRKLTVSISVSVSHLFFNCVWLSFFSASFSKSPFSIS